MEGSQRGFGGAFGRPFGSLWDTLGDLGVTLGDLGVTWDPLGLLCGAPGWPWSTILSDFDVFLTFFAQKFSQDAKTHVFSRTFLGFLKILFVFFGARPPKAGRVC